MFRRANFHNSESELVADLNKVTYRRELSLTLFKVDQSVGGKSSTMVVSQRSHSQGRNSFGEGWASTVSVSCAPLKYAYPRKRLHTIV